MRSSLYAWAALMFAVLDSGCTFYTQCPAGNSNGNPAGGAGSSGSQAGSGPLLDGQWVNVTSNLAGMASQCGNLSFGTAKPDEDLLIMGVALHGLWGSTDGGNSWSPLGSASDKEPITNRASSFLFDPDDSATFWETGIYNGTGVFKTTDDGMTFAPQNVTHNDFLSIDFTDPDRKTMLASGHEQVHKLYISTDAAATWSEIGDAIPPTAQVCPFPFVIDPMTFLLGCGTYDNGKIGIYRSMDAGGSWTQVSPYGGGSPPLVAKDGTMYWATEGTAGITKSMDQGQTWSDPPVGVGLVTGAKPVELPDGRIAELSAASVVISKDGGTSWKPASAALPYAPQSFFYSAQQKAFFIFHFTCGVGTDPVPADGVMRFDFDYETQ